ncbi:hypothetical protein [Halomonas sp. ML-15]|uniref:hypothetical protein n=1 Tax=Halomonas sp. ML-15 TaxID=2773305 RepID=UPI001CD13196|nr:hypothetical protein [Halomonas sp. ML-15]
MSFKDQAAGLRQWAGESSAAEPVASSPPGASRTRQVESAMARRTLMVVGLPANDAAPVYRLLESWRRQGQAWVGEPSAWRVVPLTTDSHHLPVLAEQQMRWALWIDSDPEAFRRSYRLLKQLAERGGPSCLMALHPRLSTSRGLLNNLRQAAAEFLGIRLLLVKPGAAGSGT